MQGEPFREGPRSLATIPPFPFSPVRLSQLIVLLLPFLSSGRESRLPINRSMSSFLPCLLLRKQAENTACGYSRGQQAKRAIYESFHIVFIVTSGTGFVNPYSADSRLKIKGTVEKASCRLCARMPCFFLLSAYNLLLRDFLHANPSRSAKQGILMPFPPFAYGTSHT